jgi:dolichol-phosphate mannosyltransferase
MNKPYVSVIIPAYLEEQNLRLILPRVIKVLSGIGKLYEVIVVDTERSMDNTAMVCRECGAIHVHREGGNDYYNAVVTGINVAKGENMIFMDADGSHTPEFIPRLIERAPNYDVVIASRYIDGGATDNKIYLVLMSRLINIVYSVVLGLKCRDVSNSFKLYKSDQLKQLKLKCRNFDIIEEILFKLHRNKKGLMIMEIPFTFKERMFGHTKRNLLSFAISYIISLIKLRLS